MNNKFYYMYYYKIFYQEYDDYAFSNWQSRVKYSNEEFIDIVQEAYKASLINIVKEEKSAICFPNVFIMPEEVIFDKDFALYLSKYYIYPVSNKIQAYVNTRKVDWAPILNTVLKESNINDDCKNDCWRLSEYANTEEEKVWCRNQCVFARQDNKLF